jgi:hypothetical protein
MNKLHVSSIRQNILLVYINVNQKIISNFKICTDEIAIRAKAHTNRK